MNDFLIVLWTFKKILWDSQSHCWYFSLLVFSKQSPLETAGHLNEWVYASLPWQQECGFMVLHSFRWHLQTPADTCLAKLEYWLHTPHLPLSNGIRSASSWAQISTQSEEMEHWCAWLGWYGIVTEAQLTTVLCWHQGRERTQMEHGLASLCRALFTNAGSSFTDAG